MNKKLKIMEDVKECPHCLGIGEELNSKKTGSITCKLCDGAGIVDNVIADAFIHSYINDEY